MIIIIIYAFRLYSVDIPPVYGGAGRIHWRSAAATQAAMTRIFQRRKSIERTKPQPGAQRQPRRLAEESAPVALDQLGPVPAGDAAVRRHRHHAEPRLANRGQADYHAQAGDPAGAADGAAARLRVRPRRRAHAAAGRRRPVAANDVVAENRRAQRRMVVR